MNCMVGSLSGKGMPALVVKIKSLEPILEQQCLTALTGVSFFHHMFHRTTYLYINSTH